MKISRMALWLGLAIAVSGVAASVATAQTGVVEGRVTLDAPPAPRRSANRYPGGGGEMHPIQELPAVVYLIGTLPGDAARNATMAQRDTTFLPPVVGIPAGGSVAFPNEDPFFHNVFSYSSAQRFDLGRYPQGESKSVTFPQAGVIEVFCEVHEFMRAAIVVTESPFFTIVGPDGTFRMTGVPPGEHRIAFWHPDHEPLEQRVVVTSGGTTRIEVELRR